MSGFNKSQEQLSKAVASAPRRFDQQQREAKAPSFTGTNIPYWMGEFKPTDSLKGPADRIRLYRGNYDVVIVGQDKELTTTQLSYVPFTDHGTRINGKYRSAVCSGGPFGCAPKDRTECLGCEKRRKNKESMGAMSRYGFGLLHYGMYAKVPQMGDDGRVKNNSKGEPYYNWERTTPQDARGKHKGFETVDERMMHWAIGYKDYGKFGTINSEISRMCKSCSTGDVSTWKWMCPNCGEDLIDPATSPLTSEEIESLTSDNIRCHACDNIGMLEEIVECSQCDKPVRADIFDVDLFVKQPLDPSTAKRGDLVITSYSRPKPVEEKYTTGESPIFKQLDLPRIFGPTSLDKQRQMFEEAGMTRDPAKAARAWGGGKAPPTV